MNDAIRRVLIGQELIRVRFCFGRGWQGHHYSFSRDGPKNSIHTKIFHPTKFSTWLMIRSQSRKAVFHYFKNKRDITILRYFKQATASMVRKESIWCYVEQVDQSEPLCKSNGWRYIGPHGITYRRRAVFGARFSVLIAVSSSEPGHKWLSSHSLGGAEHSRTCGGFAFSYQSHAVFFRDLCRCRRRLGNSSTTCSAARYKVLGLSSLNPL